MENMCGVCKSRLVLCYDEGSGICTRCSAITGYSSERREPCLHSRIEVHQQVVEAERVESARQHDNSQSSGTGADDEDSRSETDSDWIDVDLCSWAGEAHDLEADIQSYLERMSQLSDLTSDAGDSVITSSTDLPEWEEPETTAREYPSEAISNFAGAYRKPERNLTSEEIALFAGARFESLGGLDIGMQWPEDQSTASGSCEPVTSQPRTRDFGCSAESVFPLGNEGAIRSNLSLFDRIVNIISKPSEKISYISDEVFRREMEAHVKDPGHGKNALTYHLLLRASFRKRDASLPSFLVRTAISWMTQHRPEWDQATQYLEATRAVRAAMPGGKMEEMLQCWLKTVDPIDIEFLNMSIGGYRIQPRSCWSSILNFCGFTDAADLIWRRSMVRVLPEAK